MAATLAREAERMHGAQLKVELEALAGFGDDFLADFLVDKIVVRQGIATHDGEYAGGQLMTPLSRRALPPPHSPGGSF